MGGQPGLGGAVVFEVPRKVTSSSGGAGGGERAKAGKAKKRRLKKKRAAAKRATEMQNGVVMNGEGDAVAAGEDGDDGVNSDVSDS